MVEVPEISLIECPDCKRTILDNVNYCRFCGHDFNEVIDQSSGRLSRFLKNPLRGAVIDSLRYCTHCKGEIRDSNIEFCPDCGTMVSFNDNFSLCSCGNMTADPHCRLCGYRIRKTISVEDYNQILYDKLIVPLSNNYNEDFSKIDLKKYFNLTSAQERHVIYRIMYAILFDELKEDTVDFFKRIVDETKNYDNLEEAILYNIKSEIISSFYDDGIKYNRTSTVKSAHYENVETPVIQNKHGAGTKVLATVVAGPLGFVATSGVKQTNETKQVHVKGEYMHYEYLFNPTHISVKAYSNNSCVNSFSSEKTTDKIVVKWENIDYLDDEYYLILNTGELVQLRLPVLSEFVIKNILKVGGTLNGSENEEFKHKYYKKILDQTPAILVELLNKFIDKNRVNKTKDNSTNNSSIEELEKLANMYEKGLLSDDEFVSMKQNIIGNQNRSETVSENSTKFCGNCGAEIIENSKFCIQCGNQIN